MTITPAQDDEIDARIREAYPKLTDGQLLEVKQTLTQYASIIFQLMDYMENNPDAYAQFRALHNSHSVLRSDPGDFDPI